MLNNLNTFELVLIMLLLMAAITGAYRHAHSLCSRLRARWRVKRLIADWSREHDAEAAMARLVADTRARAATSMASASASGVEGRRHDRNLASAADGIAISASEHAGSTRLTIRRTVH